MKNFGIGFVIGANLASGFSSKLGLAGKKVKALGEEVKSLGEKKGRADAFVKIEKELDSLKVNFKSAVAESMALRKSMAGPDTKSFRLAQELNTTKKAFKSAAVEAFRLKKEIKDSKEPTGEMQSAYKQAQRNVDRLAQSLVKTSNAVRSAKAKEGQAYEQTQKKVAALSATYMKKGGALRNAGKEMEAAGIKVKGLASSYEKLEKALSKAEAKQKAFNSLSERQAENLTRRGELKGKLLGVAAAVAGTGAMFGKSMGYEHEMRLMGNIADLPNRRLFEIKKQINDISRLTNQKPGMLLEGLEILMGKGLSVEQSIKTLGALGKTATATGSDIKDLATTAYSLIKAMQLLPEELPRAMDVLAQSGKSGSFELKDMAQYFPALTSAALPLGLKGAEGIATIASTLQIAMQGAGDQSEAANNFQNFLAKLTSPETVRKFDEFGVNIEDAFKSAVAQGKNPIEEMVLMINDLTGGDKFRIGELFGDMQVVNFLNPMLANIEEYRKIKDKALSAKGVVDQDFINMMGTSEEKVKAFSTAIGKMGDGLASTLLPGLNLAVQPLTWLAEGATALSEKFPKTTTALSGLVVGVVGLEAASLAAGLASTYLKGAQIGLQKAFLLTKTRAVIGAVWGFGKAALSAAAGTRIWTGAQWLLNAAMAANPIGLIIAAAGVLATAGTILYHKWEPFRKVIDWIWNKIKLVGGWIIKFGPLGASLGFTEGVVKGLLSKTEATGLRTVPSVSGKSLVKSLAGTSGTGTAASAGANSRSGKGVSISFSPTIHIAAGSDTAAVKKAVDQGMVDSESRIKSIFESLYKNEERLSLSEM